MSARLRIISVNDVYSLEHLPRLTSLVRHHATHDPADRLIVVLAGDFLAPSVLSSLDGGRGMVDCLDRVPITHAILGNHEDDLDLEPLRARVRELACTLLLTNVRGFDDTLPKTDVLDVAGVRVGLLGVTACDATLYSRPPFGGARIDPANETARRVADALLADGCACVVPITHQRVDRDRELARTTPPFPVIVGGHEHDGLLERIGDTWLVKAPSEAVRAVVTDLVFSDARDARPEVHTRFDAVADYPEDEAMRARVDAHMARVAELEAATLLILGPGEALSSIGTRSRQTSMGALICSRLRDTFDADGAIFNGGGIRGARAYAERFTYGDLEREVPFDNEIIVVPLPGAVLRAAVESSRAHAPIERAGFLQVDDRMRVDDTHRLTHIGDEPLDAARVYRVALPRQIFDGLDHIEPLLRFAAETPEAVPPPTTGRDLKIALVGAFSETLWEQLGGFDAVDSDRDGVVTHDELVAAIARAGGEPPSPLAARLVLDALDRNEDGTLTPDEPRRRR